MEKLINQINLLQKRIISLKAEKAVMTNPVVLKSIDDGIEILSDELEEKRAELENVHQNFDEQAAMM